MLKNNKGETKLIQCNKSNLMLQKTVTNTCNTLTNLKTNKNIRLSLQKKCRGQGTKYPHQPQIKRKLERLQELCSQTNCFYTLSLSLFLYKGNITSAMEHDIAQKTVKQQQEQGFKEH